MKNKDLKRFYREHGDFDPKDFVRLDSDGKIDKDLLPDGSMGPEIVSLENLSGTLTDEQYTTLSGDNALILLSTQYFRKAYSASTLIVYQAMTRQAGQDSALYEYIEITKSTKAWEYKNDNIVEGNPTVPEGTEPTDLTGIRIGNTYFSISGGGPSNREFPSSWPVSSSTTTKQFCDVVNADATAVQGMSYLGEVEWSDLPASIVNAEIVVEIMDGTGTSDKVIHLILTSGNVAPYRWEYTYWNDGANVSGWIAFQDDIKTIAGYDATKVQVLTNNLGTLTWAEGTTYASLNNTQYGGNQ